METVGGMRLAAMEGVLGKSDDMVGHATIPFDIGGAGGHCLFSPPREWDRLGHREGLIGCDEQIKNRLGNYELMICQRQKDDWGDNLISQLAQYTLDSKLRPGETMDIGSAVPEMAVLPCSSSSTQRFAFAGVAAHLERCMQPRFLRLSARFNVRGGIYTTVVAERRQSGWQPSPPVSLS